MTTFEQGRNNGLQRVYSALVGEHNLSAVLVLAITVLVGIHLVTLTKSPPVDIDEPWTANAAWNWLMTGHNVDPMHADARPTHSWVFLGNAPYLISFAVFGLGLFQARLASWFFGILLLAATFLAGKRGYGLITGLLAALLLALSPQFLKGSHLARPDVTLAAIVMFTYYLATTALDGSRWWMHSLVGLVLGLSLDVHLNVIPFVLATGLLYVQAYQKRVLRRRETWLLMAGALLGFTYYLFARILPTASTMLHDYSFTIGNTHKPPLLMFSIVELLRSAIQEVGRYHFYENGVAFVAIGASVVYLAVRRSLMDRRLLLFTAAVFVGFVLIVGNKHDVYAILLYPFLMIMVAETLVSLTRSNMATLAQRAFSAALILMLLANSAIHLARPLAQNWSYDYYAVTDRIRAGIPPGSRVMGVPNWWLGLTEYDYRSSLNLPFYNFYRGYSLTEGLAAERPDYLIVDSSLRGVLTDEGYFQREAGWALLYLPKTEFEAFLSERGTKVKEFEDPWHGALEVYRIDWGSSQ